MEFASQNLSFVLILSKHPKLGTIVLPYWAKRSSKPYLTISERLSTFNMEKYRDMLPAYALDIIRLADECADSNLAKRFVTKKHPIKNFFQSVEGEYFTEFIRPFIEKQIDKIFKHAVKNDIPIYIDESSPNLYPVALIKKDDNDAETILNFTRTEDGTRYVLEVYQNDERINLSTKGSKVISYQPCWLLTGNHLHSFAKEFDGKKLEPFLKKEFISIPKSAEKKYFEAFILKNLKTSSVTAEGFDILDIKPEQKINLTLESDFNGRAIFVVYFIYGKKQIMAGRKQNVFVDLKIEEENYVFYRITRNPKWEKQIKQKFIDHGFEWISEDNSISLKADQENTVTDMYTLVEWINQNVDFLKSIDATITQHHNASKYYTSTINTDFKIQVDKDWFDIYAMIHFGTHYQIPFIQFRKYILKGIREYVLPNGDVAILPKEWFSKFKDLMLFCFDNKKSMRLQRHHFLLLNENLFDSDLVLENKVRRLDFRLAEQAIIPEGLNATLRSYQAEGLRWMQFLNKNNFGGCLADDMGLGKTIQTLALLLGTQQQNRNEAEATLLTAIQNKNHFEDIPEENSIPDNLFSSLLKEETNRKTSLIIMPASLIHNWKNEINRFAPSLITLIHTGINRNQDSKVFNKYDLVLTTYGTARNDQSLLSIYPFHYIILDESQAIKNPDSVNSQVVCSLNCDHRLVLTGTPIENSLIDLWSQMNFLNKGLLGSLNFFKNEYLFPLEKEGSEIAQRSLKKLIDPFMLRRRKDEVALELPPLIEDVRYCEMTEKQSKIYNEEKTRIRNILLESIETKGIGNSSIEVLKAMMHLRQLSNHPLMTDNTYQGDSGKFDEVLRSIQNLVEEKNKVLVFSSFVKHLTLFANKFDELGIQYAMLTGATSHREKVDKDFKDNADTRIFLISIKAGGVGLNLTEADYVFLLDPWWNPAIEQQAISRSHRIGQSKNVIAYKFITKDSIEEKILKLQEHKLLLAKTFVPSNNPLKDISKEEIVELFE
jgi:SNF2 family DNA or RNA helicase